MSWGWDKGNIVGNDAASERIESQSALPLSKCHEANARETEDHHRPRRWFGDRGRNECPSIEKRIATSGDAAGGQHIGGCNPIEFICRCERARQDEAYTSAINLSRSGCNIPNPRT